MGYCSSSSFIAGAEVSSTIAAVLPIEGEIVVEDKGILDGGTVGQIDGEYGSEPSAAQICDCIWENGWTDGKFGVSD